MTEKISVIIPVYNVREYLEYCVNSIRSQTYENLEIILVDDGSTDGSGRLCEALAGLDDRIRVLHQENQGAAGARNAGLDAAEGSYISIIDGDDYIFPGMYETLLEAMKSTQSQIGCCTYELVETHEIPPAKDVSEVSPTVLTRGEIYEHLFDYHTMWVIQPNKLYETQLFDDYRFPTGHFYEDEYAAHRLLKGVERAVYIDAPFYRYFVRPGSATRRGITSRQFYLLDALIDRLYYFLEEKEYGMLQRSEECLFQAYRSVAVGYTDRSSKNAGRLKQIRKKYRQVLPLFLEHQALSKGKKIKRKLYLSAPRLTERLILLKNRRKAAL